MKFINIELIKAWSEKTIFTPCFEIIEDRDWKHIENDFLLDCSRYMRLTEDLYFEQIKYFPGLLCTLFYRISRFLYTNDKENYAADFSSVGFSLTGCELYYSAKIGRGFKINHAIGTIVGARVTIGDDVLLHQGVTLGDKKGGRPSIGNRVVIYPNSTIVGDIIIGEDVVIGANCFVDKSIKSKIIYGKK